jgi:hypothetical protein
MTESEDVEEMKKFSLSPPPLPTKKSISAQVRPNGLKFGVYVGAEVRRL